MTTRTFGGVTFCVRKILEIADSFRYAPDRRRFMSSSNGVTLGYYPALLFTDKAVDMMNSGIMIDGEFVDNETLCRFFLCFSNQIDKQPIGDRMWDIDLPMSEWWRCIPTDFIVPKNDVGQAKVLFSYLRPFVGMSPSTVSILIVGSSGSGCGGLAMSPFCEILSSLGFSGVVDAYDVYEKTIVESLFNFTVNRHSRFYHEGGAYDVVLDDSYNPGKWCPVDFRVRFPNARIMQKSFDLRDEAQPFYDGSERRLYINVAELPEVSGGMFIGDVCRDCVLLSRLEFGLSVKTHDKFYSLFVSLGVKPCHSYRGQKEQLLRNEVMKELTRSGIVPLSSDIDENPRVLRRIMREVARENEVVGECVVSRPCAKFKGSQLRTFAFPSTGMGSNCSLASAERVIVSSEEEMGEVVAREVQTTSKIDLNLYGYERSGDKLWTKVTRVRRRGSLGVMAEGLVVVPVPVSVFSSTMDQCRAVINLCESWLDLPRTQGNYVFDTGITYEWGEALKMARARLDELESF